MPRMLVWEPGDEPVLRVLWHGFVTCQPDVGGADGGIATGHYAGKGRHRYYVAYSFGWGSPGHHACKAAERHRKATHWRLEIAFHVFEFDC